jgi:hypothetical protein
VIEDDGAARGACRFMNLTDVLPTQNTRRARPARRWDEVSASPGSDRGLRPPAGIPSATRQECDGPSSGRGRRRESKA